MSKTGVREDRKICGSDEEISEGKASEKRPNCAIDEEISQSSVRSDNVNEALEACLQSIKNNKKRTYIQARLENSEFESSNAKRLRKNNDQTKILLDEFKGEQWSKGQLEVLAGQSGLTESQVYKWNWDKLRKEKPNEAMDIELEAASN